MQDQGKVREYYEKEALALENHQKKMYFGDLWNAYWHGTRLKQILKMAEKIKFTNFLDVGCAEGLYIKLFSSSMDSEDFCCVGLDIAKNYLTKTKKKAPNASLVLGDAHHLPFREDVFDLVLCSEVLEHVLNPKMVLREIVRVSRKYVLLTVAGENLFHFFARKLGLVKMEDPYADFGHGHIHEMKISEIVASRDGRMGYECLGSIVTCYFPISFLQKHEAPTLIIRIIKTADKILGKIPVIKEFGAVQIALLGKREIKLPLGV